MFKRALCMFLSALFIACLLPAGAITVSAAPTELEVKWNTGAVGGPTNSNKNKVIANSAGYRYSDVIVIEKAGTKVYFTDSSTEGDTSTYYLGHTLLAFSTWKQSGSSWVMDLEGAQVHGTFHFGNSIGQTLVNGTIDGGMRYEFITDHDNQAIRLSYKSGSSKTDPVVYAEPTTEKSTLEQLNARDFTATFNPDGTVTGIQWFCGYASSATNTNGSAMEVRYASADYAVSGLITVPKAGTKISYSIATSNPNAAYNAFTRYTKDGNRYVYDVGFSGTDAMVKNGNTYTYVTEKDNEVIRLCVRANRSYSTIAVDAPVSVTWQQTNETGTAAALAAQKTEWPAPELISLVTGAPLIGTELKDLVWHDGYIGSQYHDSKAFTLTSPTNLDYEYSDVITVPKAGTTIYFFDQTFTDFDNGKHPSTSVLTVSHWKKIGSNWVFDKTKPYLTGCDVYNVLMTDDYRMYAYTTTEDNENIRLCMRYAPVYATEDELIPPVYLVEPTDFATVTAKGILTEAAYTDMGGSRVDYKVYLPAEYTPDKQYTLVFDNSSDGALAADLAKRNYNGIIVSYAGELEQSLRLLDQVVANYPVKVSDLLLVGSDKLAAHAVEFEHIRLAQAVLVTSGTAPSAKETAVKAISEFDSVTKAADWLIGEGEDYYTALEGLTMYAIGDSYFGGSGLGQHQTWVNLLGYKYGMTFHNYGIGGNTVASNSQTGSNQPAMHTRYNEIPTDGDIYFIEGGRNDRHYSVPFGDNASTNGTTFKGALNIMIKGIRDKNPDALIILVTAWSYENEKGYLGTNNDYADAMKELAEYYNDPHVICMYAADTEFSGIDMGDARCRLKYCLTASDVSHLNADGMYMVLPRFEAWIAEKYAAFKGVAHENSAEQSKFLEIADVLIPEETTTPADVPQTTPATQDTEPVSEGGCGSAIASYATTAAVLLSAVMFKKKKRK